jgi:hypothetical protein
MGNPTRKTIMFSLTIAFGETPAMWRLLFKTEEAAQKSYLALRNNQNTDIGLLDDFGQRCFVKPASLIAIMLEDLDQSRLAGVEMMLHNARTQAQAQTQARSEPALRSAGQGPSVFVPQGNGRM